jgi:hypothetical protein
VINNYLWKNRRTHFALQNTQGHEKDFFEIYRQFGHAPSLSFASAALVFCGQHSMPLLITR